jgi:hypothetical protein
MTDLPTPLLIDAALRMAPVLAIGAGAVALLVWLHRGDWRAPAAVIAIAALGVFLGRVQ